MEKVFKAFLILHIIAGFTAFVAAPVAMIVKKGGKRHRQWGKIFFWCMTVVSASAFVMSVLHKILFLFIISGFSYYLVSSGYRWVYRKNPKSVKDVKPLDWVVVIAAAVFNSALLVFGIYSLVKSSDDPFGYIACVLSFIGLNIVRKNIQQFYSPPKEKYAWLLNHMGGMVGGYIATVSAFSAVNFNFLPIVIQWLWPTIIGVPLLMVWINSYKKKFTKGKKVSELVEVREPVGQSTVS
jgi:uncharacterized membrane protein